MSNLFEQVVGMTPDLGLRREFPRHEVRVEDDGYRVQVELPGVAREDVDVSIVGRRLTISGTRKRFEPPAGTRMLRSEREARRFDLAVQLPGEVDAVAVIAQMRDGVLHVQLPKLSSTRGRQVPVEAPAPPEDRTPEGEGPVDPDMPAQGGPEPGPPGDQTSPGPEGEPHEPGGEHGVGGMPWEDDTTL